MILETNSCVGLTPFYTGLRMVGPALTVQTRAGDNLAIHQALEIAQPGDIIVVDGGGDTSRALVGEIMKAIAESRGVAGFVIDGAIRDVDAFRQSDFPCFARGSIHRGPYKDGPGKFGTPVSIGSTLITPGDIAVGDADGVVAFSPLIATELLSAATERLAQEAVIMELISNGNYDGRYAKA
ncbi:MAG: methyltransferase [Cypionkella sp.]|nr:RraA family protein [Cypionkella sp.]MDB5657981.1 methyltransferase [Cypionkella sp.]